jgi:P-type E1-E2 ATPase
VLIYVLLAAAVLTAVMGHWVDTLVILGVAVINALIGHIQESNAEKSLKSIRNMLSSEARVIRNGNHETIPTTEIVPGDIIVYARDRIPADMRLIEAHNLRVEEAILTGESTVVDKHESAERRIAAGRSHQHGLLRDHRQRGRRRRRGHRHRSGYRTRPHQPDDGGY